MTTGPLIGTTCFPSSKQKVCVSRLYAVIMPSLYHLLVGEHLTEAEVIECMMTLLGCSENPEVDGAYSTDVLSALEEIPENLTAPLFAEEIIGLSTQ